MVYSNGVSTLFMDMWGGEILTIPEIHIQTTLPPPPILSDSGRALSAYGVSRIVTPPLGRPSMHGLPPSAT